MTLTVTVIIPTFNRPECLRECLTRLATQVPPPNEVIVVDASHDERSREVASQFPKVSCLTNAEGRGNTPASRNLAILHSSGDILAFLDDDAYAHEGWLANLVSTYEDPRVAGVAGRALNDQPGEADRGVDDIGKVRSNGLLSGNFAADPKRLVEVDHMIGCNMSLRREVVAELGGFRDDFRAGPFGICEETEICVRARRLGYRLFFNPLVCVTHVGAPQPASTRFGPKYSYYHARNNIAMLVRSYGCGFIVWRHLAAVLSRSMEGYARRVAAAFAHLFGATAGLLVGLFMGCRFALKTGIDPSRNDSKGRQIRRRLSDNGSLSPAVDSNPNAAELGACL